MKKTNVERAIFGDEIWFRERVQRVIEREYIDIGFGEQRSLRKRQILGIYIYRERDL